MPASPGPREAEQMWEEENSKCSFYFGCKEKPMCKYQYLPRDITLSESCRLSPEYMMAHDRAKYVDIQAGLLKAKGQKLRDDCTDSGWRLNIFGAANDALKCQRRYTHVMRAITFITQAQDKEFLDSLDAEGREQQKQLFDESLASFADDRFLGPDAKYVLSLKQKLRTNPNFKETLRSDPKTGILEAVEVLSKLLRGSEADKAEAREKIDAMPSVAADVHDDEGQTEDNAKQVANDLESMSHQVREMVEDVNEFDEHRDEPSDRNDGSLVQSGAEVQTQIADANIKAIVFVVIVILVIVGLILALVQVLVAIATWFMISVLGCGVGALVNDEVVNKNEPAKHMGVKGFLRCSAKLFLAPFIYGGKAAVWMYRKVWRREKSVNGSLIEWRRQAYLSNESSTVELDWPQ